MNQEEQPPNIIILNNNNYFPPEVVEILSQYECPYKVQFFCQGNNCPFGHSTDDNNGHSLREVPDFVCIANLTNGCTEDDIPFDYNFPLTFCREGFHMSVEQFTNVDRFAADHPDSIQGFREFRHDEAEAIPEDQRPDCPICFDRVKERHLVEARCYGLMENCDHILCAHCAFSIQDTLACPFCRIESDHYLICPRFVTGEQKHQLFREQFYPNVNEVFRDLINENNNENN